MRRKLYPGNHPDVAASLNNLGLDFGALGGAENLRKAIGYYEEAISMDRALYPENHPITAATLINLRNAYRGLSREKNH